MSLIWMMWFDGDPGGLPEEAIQEAMMYYQRKYGTGPNRVQIPLNYPEVTMEGILIERDNGIQKNHLLITADREVRNRKTVVGGKSG
jgi:hypothetical protein